MNNRMPCFTLPGNAAMPMCIFFRQDECKQAQHKSCSYLLPVNPGCLHRANVGAFLIFATMLQIKE